MAGAHSQSGSCDVTTNGVGPLSPECLMSQLPIARYVRWCCLSGILCFMAASARAQDADPLPTKKDTLKFPPTGEGGFTPGAGYTIINTDKGSLNISVYGL